MVSGAGPAGKLARFFIESKLTPLLVTAALVLGLVAAVQTPREEEPQIRLPVFDVFVQLPGAEAREVESRVTLPLEKRLWGIPGVEYVYSTSMPAAALVTVRFRVGEDPERSLVAVYERLQRDLDRWPEGASAPLVRSRTIDDVPVLALTLWSERAESLELRRIALELKRELASVPDVSEIHLIGGRVRQLRVEPDLAALAAHGLDLLDLARALGWHNAALDAGAYPSANREILVETGPFLQSPDEVAALVVAAHEGRPVYLHQVARVLDGSAEPTAYVFFLEGPAAQARGIPPRERSGSPAPAVTLAFAKRAGADATRVVEQVLAQLERLRPRLVPADVHVTLTRDYGHTAQEKASELLRHLGVAIVSVTLVVALFLGWRGGLVVFVSVPITFALTLFIYYTDGYTLNRVTLFALIFVTGIVVDDSIIVVENIVRHFAMKTKTPLQAAVEAVDEVGNPTILATLTVLAAVLPMAFVRGLMGPYMRPMPVGATLAMSFSLVVALVAAPWLAYRLLRHGDPAAHEPYRVERTLAYRVARRLLVPWMRAPRRIGLFVGAVALVLLAALALFPLKRVTVKMLPYDNKSELQVLLDLPEGTTLEATWAAAREVASYLATVPAVTDLEIYAGTAAPINFNGLVRHYDLRQGANVADIQVNFVSKNERSAQSHDLARRIRPEIQRLARAHGAVAKVTEVPPGPPVLSTLVAEVYAPTDNQRSRLARQVLEVFRSTPGVVDVDWFVAAPQPKHTYAVDRETAARHGIAPAQIVEALQVAVGGRAVGLLHDPDALEPVPIQLRLPLEQRADRVALAQLRLRGRDGRLVPLAELVRRSDAAEGGYRYRKNLRPVIYVVGDVAGSEESPVYAMLAMARPLGALEPSAGTDVEIYYRMPATDPLRPHIKWDGEWQITYEVFRSLGAAFGVVLLLIYALIVAWFRSFSTPLVMMIAIPLSLVGILPGHWLLGAFFTATSMIGLIALAGIMVRNSVLLIDFIELSLERGRSLAEAVVEASAVRFRPILLTAGTVVVGATVILFDPIFQGLAISLMFGAAASTMLTLGVVPLVYFLLRRRTVKEVLPEAWRRTPRRGGTP